MNGDHIIVLDLILDRLTTKDVLTGILHCILFHRLFGTVKPKTLEVLDVTMPGVSDPDMEKLITSKVDIFRKGIEGGPSKRGRITVTFSEKKPKSGWFLYLGEEEAPWEEWVINIELRQPRDRERQAFDAALNQTLTEAIYTILTHTSSEKGRACVPLITNAIGISPFPFRIGVKVGGIELGV
ncbi:autophagy-related protein [Mycena floridula]|nr:autophagy-related protein [Mycena floridula]